MEDFLGRFSSLRKSPSAGQAGLSEHSEDRGGRDSHNPLVQHHIRQPDVAHRGVPAFEGHDLFTLFLQDLVSLGYNALRTGFLTRKAAPTMIGPSGKIQDGKRFLDGKSGPFLQMCHGLYDLFHRLRRNVGPSEGFPVFFLNIRFSVERSETTDSSFRIRSSFSRISRCRTFLCWCISLENVCSLPSGACLVHPRISPGALPVSSARSAGSTWSFRYRRTILDFSSTVQRFFLPIFRERGIFHVHVFSGKGNCVKSYQKKCHFILHGTTSVEDMEEFVDHLSDEFDRSADMNW